MNTQPKNVNSSNEDASIRPPMPKFVLVLLHGLSMEASETDKIKEAAEEAFSDDVFVIQPKCREGFKSIYLSIESQAKKVGAEVKAVLRDKYQNCSDEELQELKISLFGFSQGGLVACLLASYYGNDFNISAVITGHSPLSGTEALENTPKDVKSFKIKAEPGLSAIGHPEVYLMNASLAARFLNGFFVSKIAGFLFKGLSDMRRDSACTVRIKKFIRENKNDTGSHNIPVLLLSGYISDMTACFDYDKKHETQVREFSELYALMTTLDRNGEHDILISTRSQLCRGPSFENIASSVDDPVYPKNVSTRVFKDQLHGLNLAAILSHYAVQYGSTFFQNDQVVTFIVEFLSQHNLASF